MRSFSSPTARARLGACLFLAVLGFALPARAWKPITHVYLAEKARAELLAQNGSISLYRANYWSQTPGGLIGTYPVSSHLYQALRDYPAYYRAGVLGPDAYPDLLFGQSVIHPSTEDSGSDSEPWLRHLYSRAITPQQRAFVMGFLAHGAGDMFAHTFVNHYAVGPFSLDNGNAARHMLTEGHVGRRTPFLGDRPSGEAARYTIDTSAVNAFIHDNMIDAQRSRDGTRSNEVWKLTRNTRAISLPRLFTELRAGLEDKVAAYYTHVQWLKEQIRHYDDRCALWRPVACLQAVYYRGVLLSYNIFVGLPIQYVEAWVRDISRGLRAWPATSTEVARHVFMRTDHKINTPGAEAALSTYSHQYLCSMMGAPDAYCALSSAVETLINALTFKLDLFKELKRRILNYVVVKATGDDIETWKTRLDPEPHLVNQGVPASPPGVESSKQMDDLMHIGGSPARFDMVGFAPAYNTYAAIKLSFLDSRQQWSSVINALGVWNSDLSLKMNEYDAPNGFNGQIMLGFLRSMDWDNQWMTPDRMFVAQHHMLFMNLFMRQTGDVFDTHGTQAQRNDREEKRRRWTQGANWFSFTAQNTNNATNVGPDQQWRIELLPGETLSLGTCGVPGASSASNTYLRLFNPNGAEVASNNDACGGTQSFFTYTVPAGSTGTTYTLRAGCAGSAACSGTAAWTIRGTFTYTADDTFSALIHYTSRPLKLVEGQRLKMGTCGVPGAWGTGNTFLRLFKTPPQQVASNDDACGSLSNIDFVVPWSRGGSHQARAGCYLLDSCGGTVAYELTEAYP